MRILLLNLHFDYRRRQSNQQGLKLEGEPLEGIASSAKGPRPFT